MFFYVLCHVSIFIFPVFMACVFSEYQTGLEFQALLHRTLSESNVFVAISPCLCFFCCCCFHKSASIGKHCLRYSKGRIGISDPTSFRDTGPGKQETQTQSAYLCGLALKHLSLCTLSYCVGKVGIVMVRQLVTSLKQNPWKYLPCGDCFMLLIA